MGVQDDGDPIASRALMDRLELAVRSGEETLAREHRAWS
jgi:hypothetical protein